MIAESQGVRIAYDVHGDGEPLVLIMGLGYGRWGWEPVVEPLAARYRVITFDNRGYGDSDTPPGPYTAAQLAGDTLAVLDAAGVDRAHVVGASLGGAVAQELALRHGGRVEKLVLMATMSGVSNMHPIPAPTLALMAEAPTLDPAVAIRRFVENALEPEPRRRRSSTGSSRSGSRSRPTRRAGRRRRRSGRTFDAWEELPRIEAPTLVVQGEGDVVVDPRNAALLAERIPGAELRMVPGGHLFFWNRPDALVSLLTEFLG